MKIIQLIFCIIILSNLKLMGQIYIKPDTMDLYIKELEKLREKDSLMSNGYFTDTTYLDEDWNTVTLSTYSFYQIKTYNPTDSNWVSEKAYYRGGQIKFDRKYSNYKDGIFDGKYKDYYESGQVRKDID